MPDATVTSIAAQRALIDALRNPACYAHPVDRVEVLQTHISYVLLCGDYAYKIKKAVAPGFLDFSTLALRRHYCAEELRLNRRLAPDLYLALLSVGGPPDSPRLAADVAENEVIEVAVQMKRFAQDGLLDRQLVAGTLAPHRIDELAEALAAFHAAADRAAADSAFGTPAAVWAPMAQNFVQLRGELAGSEDGKRIAALEAWSRRRYAELSGLLAQRRADGHVRECHGDLHLGNVAIVDERLCIFDCIEFDPRLRWIDVISEIAFVSMDLAERGRSDYAYRLLDRYLQATGDYAGVPLLAFYQVYRALVRAKVAALRAVQQSGQGAGAAALAECAHYLEHAHSLTLARQRGLVLLHGVSGSGKSRQARRLLAALGALRLRSDVERKRLHGLPALAGSASGVDAGAYTAAATRATYERLVELARVLLLAGYPVLIDAANLRRWQRDAFRALAQELAVPFAIVACTAPDALLQARIERRLAAGNDASEADQAVLAQQLRTQEPLTADEEARCVHVDTDGEAGAELLPRLQRLLC